MAELSKVLVANRGEIARRVLRCLRAQGIPSVLVYHPEDAGLVAEADQSVALEGEPPVAAYLDQEAIIAACRTTGADALHPGYGFLAENATFAQRLEAEGITFIGPEARAIAAMGDKLEARAIAAAAGVPVLPGTDGPVTDAADARTQAEAIGFPVIFKASAGGGGKGMCLAWNGDDCEQAFVRTSGEAQASFGDDRIFVEKFVPRPRHIEIQVLADGRGGAVHLGERECSIQRRHQKILEEAPSPCVDAATRAAMGRCALELARAVDYRSAGTVEFILDGEGNFYFLEMNTRIQVEHPVTELVTGRDLVAEQLRIARGEPLGYEQQAVTMSGHAIEARLYAEDPEADFLPATGKLLLYRRPAGEDIRVDDGLAQGGQITAAFDPMIAKVIARGADRGQAIARLRQALARTRVLGVTTNLAFLDRVLAHPAFVAGDIHTGFIEEWAEELLPPAADAELARAAMAAAVLSHPEIAARRYHPPQPLVDMGNWRN